MNEPCTAHQDRAVQPSLRIESVSRQFDEGSVQALCDVSLTIGRGEYLAVMGPSGSGKSTLLNLIGALDRPDRGEIFFEGQSLGRMSNPALFRARTLGFIFQSFYLLPTLTALENVQIPMFAGLLPACQRVTKAEALLALVGMSHRAGHRPPKLSVGERQRVAIARALANDPMLLLADEPTGNLDSVAGAGVLDLFDSLHQQRGVTLVVITHAREVAARAQRTVWIRDGRLHTTPPDE